MLLPNDCYRLTIPLRPTCGMDAVPLLELPMEKKFGNPIHPGEILADELEEIGMNAATLAEKLDVPKNRIYQIINEQRSITADTAMRLSIFFGTTAEFWLNLQKCYELDVARQNADKLKHIRPYEPPTSNAVH